MPLQEEDLTRSLANLKLTVASTGVDGASQIVIAPLKVEQIQQTADILTDAFVASKNIEAYRRFLRRRISGNPTSRISQCPLL
jgi:hypothetical protein